MLLWMLHTLRHPIISVWYSNCHSLFCLYNSINNRWFFPFKKKFSKLNSIPVCGKINIYSTSYVSMFTMLTVNVNALIFNTLLKLIMRNERAKSDYELSSLWLRAIITCNSSLVREKNEIYDFYIIQRF